MKLIGITGGIGMGKSTCSEWLVSHGEVLTDTDQIARQLTETDSEVLDLVRRRFGEDVFDDSNQLKRSELAKVVFSDKSAREDLEAILHPRIRETWMQQVNQWREDQVSKGFVVIPLLYETAAEKVFDTVICVACSGTTQLSRLGARGWSDEEIHMRNDSQMPVKTKMELSEFVIWTEGMMKSTEEQLKMVLPRLVV